MNLFEAAVCQPARFSFRIQSFSAGQKGLAPLGKQRMESTAL